MNIQENTAPIGATAAQPASIAAAPTGAKENVVITLLRTIQTAKVALPNYDDLRSWQLATTSYRNSESKGFPLSNADERAEHQVCYQVID